MNLIATSLAKRRAKLNAQEQDRIAEINRACVERLRQRSLEIKRERDVLIATLRFGERK